MKLDIEAMAREAGFGNVVSMPHLKGFEAFARLIVERCAAVCDQLQIPNGLDLTGVMPSSAWETGTIDCADAILKLLED